MLDKIINLYNSNVWKRTIIIWLFFQILLWLIFAISYFFHQDAWININPINDNLNSEGWSLFLFIVLNNLLICILIGFGNLFARFNFITPGLVIMFIQIITIGWLAGSNNFEVPFRSVGAANIQFLKVGLWEITAYILTFSSTISKSLNESSQFLPQKWDKTTKLKDLKFNKYEIIIMIIAILSLMVAAIIETISLM